MRTFTRTVYCGKKGFWKSTIYIDILLIQHCPVQIIEVIAYDPNLKCEAPHLYTNENVLLWQLDSDLVASSQIEMEDIDKAKVDYICNLIVISRYLPDSGAFEVDIKRSLGGNSEVDGLVIAKPIGLIAYASPFMQFNRCPPNATLTTDSLINCQQQSPCGNDRGTVETAFDGLGFHHADGIHSIISSDVCGPNEGSESVILCRPMSKLPSPKSITDFAVAAEPAHGTPPTPLYSTITKTSGSAPNMIIFAGSPGNPRIVTRSKTATSTLCVSSSVNADTLIVTKVSALPLPCASAGAPCTPRDLSPRHDRACSDPEKMPCVKSSPILRVVSTTLSSLGLGLLGSLGTLPPIRRHSTKTGLSGDDEIVGLSRNTSDNCAVGLDSSAGVGAQKIDCPGTVVRVRGTPPLSPRAIVNTESSNRLIVAGHDMKIFKKSAGCTAAGGAKVPVPVPVPDDPKSRAAGVTRKPVTTSLTARLQLLGMRDALDSLRIPWLAAASGGSKGSEVSPSVSMQALDQLELETKHF